jgi:hypothetical protein
MNIQSCLEVGFRTLGEPCMYLRQRLHAGLECLQLGVSGQGVSPACSHGRPANKVDEDEVGPGEIGSDKELVSAVVGLEQSLELREELRQLFLNILLLQLSLFSLVLLKMERDDGFG